VAGFLNIFQRQADIVGMATWAQTVNVLAPIMTNEKESICQTVFYPLELYRKYCKVQV
jgi:alpha-N-arabinofuranosidase